MDTDTLTNEEPMTDDLDFDLGDVLRCKVHPMLQDEPCGKEAEWLLLRLCCDAEDTPMCDDCEREVAMLGAICIRCGHRVTASEVRTRKI